MQSFRTNLSRWCTHKGWAFYFHLFMNGYVSPAAWGGGKASHPHPLVHRPGLGGNRHFVHHPKIARCNLQVLCVAPVPLLPTHCTYCDTTFPLHIYPWIWIAQPCSHLQQM